MNVGSLFSGIGGIDLGLERAGMRIAWQCEIDPWCRRVLEKHWPSVPNYGDIRVITDECEPVDVLAGGFPCQPVSLAGRRAGQSDERWLWPEFARLVRLLRPRYVLVENVPGLLSAGMGDVLGDLAACGYDAEWDSIGAVDVGAPHRRKRVWIVAYPKRDGLEGRQQAWTTARPVGGGRQVSDAATMQREAIQRHEPNGVLPSVLAHAEGIAERAGLRAGEPRIFRRGRLSDLRSARHTWIAEPDVVRVADGVPARVDRLRGLGNAVVPQVVEWIGRRMIEDAA